MCIACPQPGAGLQGAGNTLEFTAMKVSQTDIAKRHPVHESGSSLIPSVDYYHVELNKHGKKIQP